MGTLALTLALASVALLIAMAVIAAVATCTPRFTATVYMAAAMVGLAAFCAGISALIDHPAEVVLPVGLPWLGAHFRTDPLAGFFLVVLGIGIIAASLYAVGYGRHEAEPKRVLPFFCIFLAGMVLVVIAADAYSFLFSWELMSLTSWALVMAHHRRAENAHAGYVYIMMATFGTFALLLAFAILAGPDGNYSFEAMRIQHPQSLLASVALGLVMLGAGSKAGLVPVHVWLPLAHAAAPSHVSALMSGIMTKVAIYGFIRIVFDLLGPPQWWWGAPVLASGGASAALGVLYALMQTDLKRVLAYSTIENVGFVFAGLGLSLAFWANGLAGAAALSLTAALFHVLNHTLFKSALFFGAGAVLTATNERQMDRLGGLIRRMPVTAVLVLLACAAISALPPLNGFASEWLLLQAILLSPQLPQWGLKLLVPAVGALLALAAALAAACFVRLFGVVFLGRPRSFAAGAAVDVDKWSLGAMAGLVALCILAGILPGLIIDALAPVSRSLVRASMPSQLGIPWLSIVPIAESRSSYNALLVLVFVTLSASMAAYAIHRLASNAVRRAPPWDCGFPESSPTTQYSAVSFAQPIQRVFGTTLFRAREYVDMPAPGEVRPATLDRQLRDLAWDLVYTPLAHAILTVARKLNWLQALTIRQYLSLVFAVLVALLLALALWP